MCIHSRNPAYIAERVKEVTKRYHPEKNEAARHRSLKQIGHITTPKIYLRKLLRRTTWSKEVRQALEEDLAWSLETKFQRRR